ncbi:MAG: MerR family transcriptional regulator [bacterium]
MKNTFWLSSSEVTRKLDISLRQLYYWELKGIVKPKMITMGSREFKRYSAKDFEILKLIKDYLDQGYTLNSAVQRAKVEIE